MPSFHSLQISDEADRDIGDLLAYSLATWGPEQQAAYAAALADAFERLIAYPDLGRSRDDVFPGCRALRVRQHVVFYRIDGETVRVGRVLHVRSDADAAFSS